MKLRTELWSSNRCENLCRRNAKAGHSKTRCLSSRMFLFAHVDVSCKHMVYVSSRSQIPPNKRCAIAHCEAPSLRRTITFAPSPSLVTFWRCARAHKQAALFCSFGLSTIRSQFRAPSNLPRLHICLFEQQFTAVSLLLRAAIPSNGKERQRMATIKSVQNP